MAILRRKEIANMSVQELQDKLKHLRIELMKVNAQRATRQSSGKIKEIKRTIAKIYTTLKKKQSKEQSVKKNIK